ncbi:MULTISPECIES: UDP-N-acetylglucosamine 2-epimerase [unclassified Pseudomonas]|uniref:UDP-N-acetylglucosamine 2-epimerase n=1 Tax=unclassified Pseudomonas TaxID=196821 RepID=UPI000876E0CA|nr:MULTISPECIES: UDP-N-acetylglucosamine 2-epimerase [unclassified Pseudomonas]SCZ27896.1 UDP-N-acetylglucosamine 2-epimerase (non-hydrolysing) [Pseudomonas sp. NFACC44-2]SDA75617.1 UDP-N-acetylglucosamine 2-epimerase (non-hydrolysing) [Pseudomonas sp. NFACC51]SEJ30888.1 UDP-N-acetylglucosamine 2-epimerase (non-hydrolysing) [Pseudomonas sp. NFACC07-1]SFH43768.1 UDP-N-acetylglucosamine 2-epimerase (non-hydrolysing) [Pseudomonas sp. NFACC54]SFT15300.1 UDP-N-acetylglucosamine 2-epimerase (non-hyd
MKRRIAVFTGARAEYGLLYWLLKELKASPSVDLQLIVSGMHLSPEFGDTWKAIVQDGFDIDAKVEMLLSSDSAVGVVKSMGVGLLGFADALERLKPDCLVILGDRYEALAIAQSAMIMRIPIAHLHGGEVTEGAYDDAIRHSITKMSYLHFVATDVYRKRVIQLGESPDRVFNVGAIGLEHFNRSAVMSCEELSNSLGLELNAPFFLVTYHPVTLEGEDPAQSFTSLLIALDQFPDHQVIMTYPNSDNGGRTIIPLIEAYASKYPKRVKAIASLGFRRYHSALKHALVVVGNSSSGIIEAPSMGVPSIDIGIRQRGRLAAESVLHCPAHVPAIQEAIAKASSPSFQELSRNVVNPYGDGHTVERIVEILTTCALQPTKPFFDA